ncbi:DUF1918 domain-containing protein [Blastococcus sp. MG754426]|uniref:DUF1918 domain-containing protein n=1 Tax=unclassified Blastococcus TaxID=2619396 RepID=UPI001EF04830|nr:MULTISPECIES: DUF1918 domain-containing protein [unclassified Blastococcus]MCF6506455.1 DUF1918 domain-containing protein [Blastococcus sp. MG754426]MCF6511260.1 DUF1918 domain-containing protein [Blastococcus sp. MG754427]MCF6736827.1 DUF1918 domain-containing protein [Blastococcus sp. KM273129]
MRVRVGDRLVVHSRRVDDGVREGEVVEIPHADGSPPYVVRWLDDQRTSLVFPGPDVSLRPDEHATERAGG